MLGLTIRMNASEDSITTPDGRKFDRSRMSPEDRKRITRLVRALCKHELEIQQNG